MFIYTVLYIMTEITGFNELFTSYSRSAESHCRGCYALTSYYHTPKSWNAPFVVKIGLSMNLYNRMNNYNLYYPEGFYVLAFVFLPLASDDSEVLALERSIHAEGNRYANEWFHVKNIKHLHTLLVKGCKDFPKARIVTDLSKRISLPSAYIPMALKDLKVIRKITADQEREKRAQQEELAKRKATVTVSNSRGPSYNTRFFNLKRNGGSKEQPIEL